MVPWIVSLLVACFITDTDRAQAYDRDGDGFESDEVGGEDCEDGEPTIFPGAFESCLDSVDSDCDLADCPPRVDVDLEAEAALAIGQKGSHQLQAADGEREPAAGAGGHRSRSPPAHLPPGRLLQPADPRPQRGHPGRRGHRPSAGPHRHQRPAGGLRLAQGADGPSQPLRGPRG